MVGDALRVGVATVEDAVGDAAEDAAGSAEAGAEVCLVGRRSAQIMSGWEPWDSAEPLALRPLDYSFLACQQEEHWERGDCCESSQQMQDEQVTN